MKKFQIIIGFILFLAACKRDSMVPDKVYKYLGNYYGVCYTYSVQFNSATSFTTTIDTSFVTINIVEDVNTSTINAKIEPNGYSYPFNINLIKEGQTIISSYYNTGPPITVRFLKDSVYMSVNFRQITSQNVSAKKMN